jgi:advillin
MTNVNFLFDSINSFLTEKKIAVEVDLTALSLNSRDAFILAYQPSSGQLAEYIWFGQGVTPAERDRTNKLAPTIIGNGNVEIIEEGKESKAFWNLLGGEAEYPDTDYLKLSNWSAKLFECSFASGDFSAEQLFNFCQDDLSADYVYILDVFHEVYVWAGPSDDNDLLTNSLQIAMEYVKQNPDGRSKDTNCVYCVQAGQEPLLFTCHFPGWKGLLSAQKNKRRRIDIAEMFKEGQKVYTYSELIAKPPPKGLDPSKLETYLSEEEFFSIFQMKIQQFAKLPDWMQTNKKTEVGLF